jgi:hypothetical protein
LPRQAGALLKVGALHAVNATENFGNLLVSNNTISTLHEWWNGAIAPPDVNLTADAAGEAAQTTGEKWQAASSSATHELVLLVRKAISQAVVHATLAGLTLLWASEAAFVLFLALSQHAWLLTLVAMRTIKRWFNKAVPATRTAISEFPRSTEEFRQKMNYQLNLIGLQWEQTMTNLWGGYLKKRQKWMRESSAKSADSAGDSLVNSAGSWWDERVTSLNKKWVSWQIRSAKENKPGRAAPSSSSRVVPVGEKVHDRPEDSEQQLHHVEETPLKNNNDPSERKWWNWHPSRKGKDADVRDDEKHQQGIPKHSSEYTDVADDENHQQGITKHSSE